MKKIVLMISLVVLFFLSVCFSGPSFAQTLDNDYEKVEMMNDPLRWYNERMSRVNNKIDKYAIRPVAKGWRWLLPDIIRSKTDNFIKTYAGWPKRLINSAAQLKIKRTAIVLVRPIINTATLTTYDLAAKMNLPKPPTEDFGQTLGKWGMSHGFYLVLPILGPCSGRDFIGLVVDGLTNPIWWFLLPYEAISVAAFEKENNYSLNLRWIEGIEDSTLDWYIATRNMYFQYRNARVAE